MINIYDGGGILHVIHEHGINPRAQVLRTHHLPRWRAGALTGVSIDISNWEQLSIVLSEIERSDGDMVHVSNRAEFENRPPESMGVFLSVEGYESFAGDLDALYVLAEVGITAFTFSHNVQNKLCTGSNERYEGGFSHLGRATLRELEALPLMVDLVHMSRTSFWEALDFYEGDVFVSHSNSDALCPHPRNLTDDQIRAVAERSGVIGLNTYRGYVNPEPFQATLADYVSHAMHMCELVGPEHVAIGADFCGAPMELIAPSLDAADPADDQGMKQHGVEIYAHGPVGIEDASQMGKLPVALAERGCSPAEIDLICGGSYLAMLARARP